MTAPSGRVVRNVHHGTRVTTEGVDDSDVALRAQTVDVAEALPEASAADAADGAAVERAVEFSTPFDYLFDTLAGEFPDKHLPGDAATVVSRARRRSARDDRERAAAGRASWRPRATRRSRRSTPTGASSSTTTSR